MLPAESLEEDLYKDEDRKIYGTNHDIRVIV